MFPFRFPPLLTLFLSCIFFSSLPAQTLTVLQEKTSVGEQTSLLFGIQVEIPEGGILYAPTPPGRSSTFSPPRLEIEDQENVAEVIPLFPSGRRIEEEGIEAWIFEDRVILPISIAIHQKNDPAFIEGALEGIFCWKNRCHPTLLPFQVSWSGKGGGEGPGAQILQKALQTSGEEESIWEELLQNLKEAGLVEDPTEETTSFWVALGCALLGGLILNLMPCVLPVLAIKAMSLLKTTEGSSRGRGLWANFLGVQSFFFLFGVLSIVLRLSSGQVLSWGAHFQQPWFLGGLMSVMILFGTNLMGWWEIFLPPKANLWLQRLGEKGDFFKGFIAALLATPCSAPFLGAALGATLLLSPIQGFLVLISIGIGLGSPFLFLALFPSLARFFPSPGPWMIWMKRILAVGLFLTAAWLGSTLLDSHVVQSHSLRSGWERFSEERLQTARQEGEKILVNMTASWCLTCQLNTVRIWNHLSPEPGEVWLEGDWTQADPALADFIQRFGRNGIPFTVVFSPQNPQGKVLPELLSLSEVQTALGRSLTP